MTRPRRICCAISNSCAPFWSGTKRTSTFCRRDDRRMGEWHSEKKARQPQKNPARAAQAAPEVCISKCACPGCSSCSVSGTLPIAGLGCTTTLFSVISRRSNMKTAALTRARACIARLWRNRRRAHRMASFIGAVGTMQWRLLRRPARGGAAGGASLHFFERSARLSRLPRGRNQNDDGPLEAAGDHAGAFG